MNHQLTTRALTTMFDRRSIVAACPAVCCCAGSRRRGPIQCGKTATKFASNSFTDPVDYKFSAVPIIVRGTLSF